MFFAKRFGGVFIFALLFLKLSANVFAAGESIKSFNSDIQIQKTGVVSIRETIVYDFGSEPHHGIIRTIPIIYANDEGKKYEAGFNLVSVTNNIGLPYAFQESQEGEEMSIRVGDADKTITGTHTYVMTYAMTGVIQQYSDHDELLIDVTGNGWSVPISSVTATISFEPGVSVNQAYLQAICFVGSYGSTDKNCTYSVSDSKGEYSAKNLNAFEGLTAGLYFPSNTVSYIPLTYIPENQVVNTIEEHPQLFLNLLLVWLAVGNIILPIIFIMVWWKKGRDPKVFAPAVRSFDPPKTTGGRKLTPVEMGAIVDEQINPRDISAELIHLAIHKYVIIKEDKKKMLGLIPGDITLTRGPAFKTDSDLKKLPKHQRDLLNVFELDKKQSVQLADIQDTAYKRLQSLKDDLYKQVVADGFFPENPDKRRGKYSLFLFLTVLFLSPFLAAVIIAISRAMGRRTIAGVHAKQQSLGLKQFLVSQERQYEFQEKNKFLFEKLLPYAIVFGVAKIWAKKFEQYTDYKPDWYTGNSSIMHNPVLLTNHLERNLSRVESHYTPTQTRSSSGFSSGFSGGGGSFSGGGFSGGGGSSW